MNRRKSDAQQPDRIPTYAEYVYIFRCLSHRSRIRLLELLARRGELSVTALTRELGREGSTVSRHLNTLKMHELVRSRRQGQTKYYALNAERIEGIFKGFLSFLDRAGVKR